MSQITITAVFPVLEYSAGSRLLRSGVRSVSPG